VEAAEATVREASTILALHLYLGAQILEI